MDAVIAAVRIRGSVNVSKDIKKTMDMLRLLKVNQCVIVPKNPSHEGMLKKAKDFITWGEIDPRVLERLVAKRARLPGGKRLEAKDAKNIAAKVAKGDEVSIKPVFRLSPPSKGFRSIRSHYPRGDLGNRGKEINKLLERMI